MGGLLFSNPGPKGEPPLKTPRFPPEIYNKLRDKYIEELKNYYEIVEALTEVPGKADFGDIDLIAEGPKFPFTSDQLAAQLRAARHTVNGRLASFAVARPDAEGLYVQLDVDVCPNGFIQWEKFHKSYGDLWQILGTIIRDVGLTASDTGLHVRIPELENVKGWKGARMILTKDPIETMRFFGLDAEKYYAGFMSVEDIYRWCASCRFYSTVRFRDRKVTADDRRRTNTRKMYRDFVEEWVPFHPDAGLQQRPGTRQQILQEALVRFGKVAEYDKIMEAQTLAEAEAALWSRIAALLPFAGNAKNLTMRALKRWTCFIDGKPVIRAVPVVAYENLPLWVSLFPAAEIDNILEWVSSHWGMVKSLEKRRVSVDKASQRY